MQYGKQRVTAVHIRAWDAAAAMVDADVEKCERAAAADRADAAATARRLGIDMWDADCERDYWLGVWEPAVAAFAGGSDTPNPDVGCNREVKFGALLRVARDRMGVEPTVVTGHYARTWRDAAGRPHLAAAAHAAKDQSYFLAGVRAESLARARFPLGSARDKATVRFHTCRAYFPLLLTPPLQVRAVAKSLGFPNWARKDSYGVCMAHGAPGGTFRSLLAAFVPDDTPPPRVVDVDTGATVAERAPRPLAFYTVGQGAGLGGAAARLYVAAKDPATNTLAVCAGWRHPALLATAVDLRGGDDQWWLARPAPGARVACRVRYQAPLVAGVVTASGVALDEPVRAATPGQVLVMYDTAGSEVLGGGIIDRALG